jgi:hypothetical protein
MHLRWFGNVVWVIARRATSVVGGLLERGLRLDGCLVGLWLVWWEGVLRLRGRGCGILLLVLRRLGILLLLLLSMARRYTLLCRSSILRRYLLPMRPRRPRTLSDSFVPGLVSRLNGYLRFLHLHGCFQVRKPIARSSLR